jgi:hypothetical protein
MKTNKFLDILLTIITVVTLLVIAIPTTIVLGETEPLSSPIVATSTGAWSAVNTPLPPFTGTYNQTLVEGGNITLLEMAPDGTTMYAYEDAIIDKFLKSTDAGVTWTVIPFTSPTFSTVPATPFRALAISGSIVVLSDANNTIFISFSQGASFVNMAATLPAGNVTSIDLYWYDSYQVPFPYLVVGTSNGAGGGGAILYTPGILIGSWTNLLTGGDVLDIAFSPNYAIDPGIVAVIAPSIGNIQVASKLGTNPWNLNYTAGDFGFMRTVNTRAVLTLPTGFSLTENNTKMLVGISGCSGTFPSGIYYNNLYKVNLAVTGSGLPSSVSTVFNSTGSATPVYSIDYEGTWSTGTVYIGLSGGSVMRSDSVSVVSPVFIPPSPLKSPIGAANTIVVQNPTNADVYAGTSGTGSALNISTDNGQTYNQISLIRVSAMGRLKILDVAVVDINILFLVLYDDVDASGTPTAGDTTGLYKTINGGASWTQVMFNITTGSEVLYRVCPSPDYATDSTLFMSRNDARYFKSSNGGSTYSAHVAPYNSSINLMLVLDANNYYIATTLGIYKNGSTQGATITGNAYSMVMGSTTDMFVGTTTGTVYVSTDAGVSFNPLGIPGGIGALGNNVSVAVDAGYAQNKTLYIGSTYGMYIVNLNGGGASIIFNVTTLPSDTTPVIDIVIGTDRALYALKTDGGVRRQVSPSAMPSAPYLAVPWDTIMAPAGSSPASGLIEINNPENTLYSFSNNSLYTYRDSMVNAPAIISPAAGSITTPTVTFSWGSLGPGVQYTLEVARYSDFTDSVKTTGLTVNSNVQPPLGITFTPGYTYYWRVIATYPLYSRYSPTTSFTVLSESISGDANNDGKVNVGDILTIEMIMLFLAPISESADVNGDGFINVADILILELIMLDRFP